MTDADWADLPEVSNMTGKKTKRNPRFDREYAVPDSVTLSNLAQSQSEGALTEEQMSASTPGSGAMTDLVEIGNQRDKMLSLKLDQVRRWALFSRSWLLGVLTGVPWFCRVPPMRREAADCQPRSILKATLQVSTAWSFSQTRRSGTFLSHYYIKPASS